MHKQLNNTLFVLIFAGQIFAILIFANHNHLKKIAIRIFIKHGYLKIIAILIFTHTTVFKTSCTFTNRQLVQRYYA